AAHRSPSYRDDPRSATRRPHRLSPVRCRSPYFSGLRRSVQRIFTPEDVVFPGFLLALHRQGWKSTIFTPRPPCHGDSSRCKLDTALRSRAVEANRRDSTRVRLGGPGGFSVPQDDPSLPRGNPRLLSPAGSAGGSGTRAGRLFDRPAL